MRPAERLLWTLMAAVCGGGCSTAPSAANGPGDTTVPGAADVAVEVHGADAEAIVARCVSTRATDGIDPGCWHAPSRDGCAALLHRLGCAEVAFGPDDRALVAVVVPGAPRLERVMIGSEEGVDVLTLVLGAPPAAAEPATRAAMLLWVDRRPHQLAVVCRDVPADTERTVGIFDGR